MIRFKQTGPTRQTFNLFQNVFFYLFLFLKRQILGLTLKGHISLKNDQKNMSLFAAALFSNYLSNDTGFK